jgi:hypothetical protein
MKALAGALLACAVGAAQAQNVVTLVCSSTHDGPPQYQIEIDYARSTVSYPNPNTAAQISENQISWQRPRYESRTGEVRVEGHYRLNRTTGVLSAENICLARDSSWCNPGGSVSYCKRAMRQF